MPRWLMFSSEAVFLLMMGRGVLLRLLPICQRAGFNCLGPSSFSRMNRRLEPLRWCRSIMTRSGANAQDLKLLIALI